MAGGAEASREELGGDDEGGGVGAEVGEEEGEGVEHEERDVVATAVLAVIARVAAEVVVHEGDDEHEEGHEEEARELDDPPPHHVDERHGEPVAWYCGAERDQRLRSAHEEHLLQRAHGRLRRQPPHRREYVFLEQILRVERHVQQKPCARAPQQLHAVPPQEPLGEQPVLRHCTPNNQHTSRSSKLKTDNTVSREGSTSAVNPISNVVELRSGPLFLL